MKEARYLMISVNKAELPMKDRDGAKVMGTISWVGDDHSFVILDTLRAAQPAPGGGAPQQ